MMKNRILTILMLLATHIVWAQSKAQVMLQQVVEYATTLKTLNDGYKIASKGLSDLHNLKNGSFGLNQAYFNSLRDVSPAVKGNKKLPAIIQYQQEMISFFQTEIGWQKDQRILGDDEIAYLQKVYEHILSENNKELDELNLVTAPGTQMSDEERIKRIDRIYASATDRYVFSWTFINKARTVAQERKSNSEQSKVIRKLYDIN